jgi:hypothetical protein
LEGQSATKSASFCLGIIARWMGHAEQQASTNPYKGRNMSAVWERRRNRISNSGAVH